jgi:hypothetical protein
VIRDALVRLHQIVLNAWFLVLASNRLLLEAASEYDRLFLMFLSPLIDLLKFHDLKGGLVNHLDIFNKLGRSLKVPARGHLNLIALDWSYLICVLPFHGLILSAHLSVAQIIGVVVSLCEVGRRSETLPTGLLGPAEHLRGINPLKHYRGLLIRMISLQTGNLTHYGCLLFTLAFL